MISTNSPFQAQQTNWPIFAHLRASWEIPSSLWSPTGVATLQNTYFSLRSQILVQQAELEIGRADIRDGERRAEKAVEAVSVGSGDE